MSLTTSRSCKQCFSSRVRKPVFQPTAECLLKAGTIQADAKSGEPIGAALKGHGGWLTSVAFSPGGTRIVSGGWDRTSGCGMSKAETKSPDLDSTRVLAPGVADTLAAGNPGYRAYVSYN